MTASERFAALVAGKPIDRLPAIEWAPWWNLTVDRWRAEGVPAEALATVAHLQEYFGLDLCVQTNVSPRTADTPTAKVFGEGVLLDEADYERIKPTLFPSPETKVTDGHFAYLRRLREEKDALLFFTVEGAFWFPRVLMGIEDHFYSFYDQPQLYHRMCEDYADWLERLFDYVFSRFHFDFMTFAEDMSYNNGPMLSRDHFDEFLAPFYKRVIPLAHKHGIPVLIDSDGDVTLAVDWYASVGADGIFPLERQAGVDVSSYIQKQPDLLYLGHFDKMCMKHGEEAMRAEFERLLPSMRAGKFLPSVDHQTPPDVSVETYRTYVRLLREYTEKAVR